MPLLYLFLFVLPCFHISHTSDTMPAEFVHSGYQPPLWSRTCPVCMSCHTFSSCVHRKQIVCRVAEASRVQHTHSLTNNADSLHLMNRCNGCVIHVSFRACTQHSCMAAHC